MRKIRTKQFPKHWNKTSDNILEAGSVVVDAKRTLAPAYFKDFRKNLNLSERVTQSLIKIGKMKRFYDADVRPNLPDSWGTLEVLTALNGRKFEELVSSGMLNKKLTRKIANSLLKSSSNATVPTDWSHTEKVITIRVDRKNRDASYIRKIKDHIYQTIEVLHEFDGMIDAQIG